MSTGWVDDGREMREELYKDAVEGRRLLLVSPFGAGEVDACFWRWPKLTLMEVGVPVGEAAGMSDEVIGPMKVLKVPEVLGGRMLYLVVELRGARSSWLV